jgi:chlorite dismutase
MHNSRLFSFVAGESGAWRVERMETVVGAALPRAAWLQICAGESDVTTPTAWTLRGVTSNERYVTQAEKANLVVRQQGLGRLTSTCAALIPIRKSAAWWALSQDERRRVFEERSAHVHIGLEYLPAIARRLHHCRDLDSAEPFDFLTWFEFAPEDAAAFDRLVSALRASEEWRYVEREVDIRLIRTT